MTTAFDTESFWVNDIAELLEGHLGQVSTVFDIVFPNRADQ